MAKPRLKPSGKWEIGLRHPLLPGGRRYFTFDTEADANTYAEQWRLMKLAGIEPPAELLKPVERGETLGVLIRQWANSGHAAPSQQLTLSTLMREVGGVKLREATYPWLSGYVQSLKVQQNLSPGSIRHRVQALSRAIDEYQRHNPDALVQNPVKLLPKGYSAYNDVDQRLVLAADKTVKRDTARDRRLKPGEEDAIVRALSGWQRPDRERGLLLVGGNALLAMFLLIVNSGLRLREAYTLRRNQIDMEGKVMRVQSTKQWRGKVVFRDVPMRPEVHRALADYMATRHLLPGAYLFPFLDEDGGIDLTTCSSRLSARYRIAFEYAGCDGLREHDLRHEATCRWLELKDARGMWMFRLEEINRLMGWSANSTMAQRYASFRGTDLAQRLWVNEEPAKPARRGAGMSRA